MRLRTPVQDPDSAENRQADLSHCARLYAILFRLFCDVSLSECHYVVGRKGICWKTGTRCSRRSKVKTKDVYRTIPSNRVLNHLIVSAWVMRWGKPIFDLQRLRVATRSPGRVLIGSTINNDPTRAITLNIKIYTHMQQ